ncbi:MAG: hypothetical protein MRERV_67c008, partial [Mycoplasmataceae bacterium RV_VA103A]
IFLIEKVDKRPNWTFVNNYHESQLSHLLLDGDGNNEHLSHQFLFFWCEIICKLGLKVWF